MNIQSSIRAQLPFRDKQSKRPPLKRISCLLPIWGFAYVKQFLDVGLSTLLADGNLPALSRTLPTEFVIMTSREDEMYLKAHPAFDRLSSVCEVKIRYVDHLITGNNYSTTITLAYTEAVRACGQDMLDTCFFFLVSDYILADGSLGNVIRRIMAGTNGILVGNFQVVEEDALPWLLEAQQKSRNRGVQLKSRDLMHWALSHLHPATVANTVNYPMNHNDHTNRLFWRVDNQTLIGRFYLMHMIAIRPEVTDFIIGSSCDYSFVPEMCPSNNVEIIVDSDEYLVIEMQPRNHESKYLTPGPHKIDKLAKVMSEWTTDRHRENSATTVVFHAADIPAAKVKKSIAIADRFVAKVRAKLRRRPRSHRRHPYWTGAIASFNEASGAALSSEEWRLALGLPNIGLDENYAARWVQEKMRFAMFGKPPHVRPWHPRYPDHTLVVNSLARLKLGITSRMLMVSDGPTIFTATFSDGGDRVVRLRSSHMLKQPYEVYEPLNQRFDVCLVELEEREFSTVDELLDRIAPMMKDRATVFVSLGNRRNGDDTQEFQRSVGFHASRLLRPYTDTAIFKFVTTNSIRRKTLGSMIAMAKLAQSNPAAGLPPLLLFGLPLSVASAVGNGLAFVKTGTPPKGYVSSALVSLTIDAECARDAYLYSNSRILRDRKLTRLGFPDDYKLPIRQDVGRAAPTEYLLTGRGESEASLPFAKPPAAVAEINPTMKAIGSGMDKMTELPEGTREPQYNRCLEIKNKQGLTSLGLMTNQVWEDDPRRLTFLLARYKFVSKMLAGKKFVGELGCGDAFGTRIVMQTTEKVVAYDFDPVFIDDIRQRRSEKWPVESHFHDILEKPLPNTHDGIYSLDVIEHIERAHEDAYITNLKDSLSDDGVLIIGSPSLESQTYASPPSKEGHVNCKSGDELKALMGNYFHNVFLFSMNDEVVHTGFTPMAHYLFAMSCNKK